MRRSSVENIWRTHGLVQAKSWRWHYAIPRPRIRNNSTTAASAATVHVSAKSVKKVHDVLATNANFLPSLPFWPRMEKRLSDWSWFHKLLSEFWLLFGGICITTKSRIQKIVWFPKKLMMVMWLMTAVEIATLKRQLQRELEVQIASRNARGNSNWNCGVSLCCPNSAIDRSDVEKGFVVRRNFARFGVNRQTFVKVKPILYYLWGTSFEYLWTTCN